MQKKTLETLLYSAGGVIALAAIVVAVNFLTSAFNARIDLTASHSLLEFGFGVGAQLKILAGRRSNVPS